MIILNVRILVYWYSSQHCTVRWHTAYSSYFSIGNGTRQGGVLSPYLFTRYIRELINTVAKMNIGCKIAGQMVNIVAHGDDIVLLAASWRALQLLQLTTLVAQAHATDLYCNTDKTVAMVFPPKNRRLVIGNNFPLFRLGHEVIKYVSSFKYLGHVIMLR